MNKIAKGVTEKIIAQIEEGLTDADLLMPWHTMNLLDQRNVTTDSLYRGMNVLALAIAVCERGYKHTLWATYRQYQTAGLQVQKGVKGVHLIKWVVKEDESGKEVQAFPRIFSVFNIEDTNAADVRPDLLFASGYTRDRAEIEQFVAATGASIEHGSMEGAFYRPTTDTIHMPDRSDFLSTDDYYSTLFHELGHWTASRVDRPSVTRGTDDYAKEELVAELTAAMLCSRFGVAPKLPKGHAAYIQHWLAALRGDSTLIGKCASLAGKAVDYLLAVNPIEAAA